MRSISIVALVCLICAVYAQEQSGNHEPVVVTTNGPGLISRLLFWQKKPEKDVAGTVVVSPRPSVHHRGDSSVEALPKESTDRMINDAIAERLLEESREQQSIVGSPFIEEKATDDHQASASETNPQTTSPDRTGLSKSVADKPTESLPLTEALRIVNTSNLTGCVARVICELSCNANAYGSPGRVVFRNMIKIQFDQSIQGDDVKFFRQAAAKGRQIVQAKRECKECYNIFSHCNSSSHDLVAVSAMFKL